MCYYKCKDMGDCMSDAILANEESLLRLISDLESHCENVSSYLNDTSTIISDMSKCIDSSLLQTITNKFTDYETQFSSIIQDLQSYIDDFKKVSENFSVQQSTISVNEIDSDKGGETVNVKH